MEMAHSLINAIVIDDEEFARDELAQLLTETGTIRVIETASNAVVGLKMIAQHKPDVVFLDIQMPQISGLEMLSMIADEIMPHIVFVTAFDQYAIQAFDDNAFDYLLKPIDPKRLNKTIHRLQQQLKPFNPQDNQQHQAISNLAPKLLEQVPCSGHNRILIIPVPNIESAFSDLAGVHIQTPDQVFTSQLTLKILEEKTTLIRCHRQYLVNLAHIKEIKLLENGLAEIHTQSSATIPVSRRYLKTIKESFCLY